MSDNHRVYRSIRSGLAKLYPQRHLNGDQVRHLNTLAGMVAGIVQGKESQLPKIAGKAPDATQKESRVKRFSRLLKNDGIDQTIYYLPFILPIILSVLRSSGTMTVAIDGTTSGRGCVTLMISLIYHKRAIPLAWLTVKAKKGHLPEDIHLKLLAQFHAILPEEYADTARIVFLGDGEFDGIRLQAAIAEAGWEYVCRTAKNCIINDEGDQFSLSDVAIVPDQVLDIPNVTVTHEQYGSVMVIIQWRKGYKDPIYLVTNMDCVYEACEFYRRRFRIETFFSDQKSRGFNLQKSHLSHPDRIARLLIASCLAYVWIIYLGVQARNSDDIMRQIHRTDRCDLSFFQLGLLHLDYLLERGLSIFISFLLPFDYSFD